MGGVVVILDKMNWGKGVGSGSCILVVGGRGEHERPTLLTCFTIESLSRERRGI